jgi:hypothetical protein
VSPGGTLIASGKKLDQIWSATINGEVATLSYTVDSLEVSIPAGLAPGKYNLEMQTAYGKLTYINAILVKAKPVLASFTLKGSGSQVSLDLADELRSIGSMFSSDYSKIHCLVNTSNPDAADIAAEVCGVLKSGSLASAKTLSSTKSTYKGSGFWVKVYLAG